ncbi:unnamed protein product [Lactuca saligna]|uniref:Uncharacterized protein n=1 Tax=Lactuca saligna TaxID=75948 RepID=A0AA36E6I7_LACSI|nr:unnamed protein product [Lactuca saligna]
MPHNRKHTQKTIPTCGSVKKKPSMRIPGSQNLSGNFHPYHTVLVKPRRDSMLETSREPQKRRIHDPPWIADVVNEWVRDQRGTHHFEVGQCSRIKPLSTTKKDMLSLMFDHTM